MYCYLRGDMNTIQKILLSFAMLCLTACASQQTRVTQQPETQEISPQELEAMIPAATASISLDELVADAKAGKTPDEIIAKIKASNSRYELTPEQTLALNQQGLDIKVLNYIHEANEAVRQAAIAEVMNKRQQSELEKARQLRRQRDLARMRYYDPWSIYYRYPWVGPIGPGFYRWGPGARWGWRYGW